MSDGYQNIKTIGQVTCGLQKFMFTIGLCVGLARGYYERRYCYEHHADAVAALAEWDGLGHPSGPWIKCKGAGVDLLNPEFAMEHV